MHKLRNIKWLPVLMVLTIMAIAAFQFYWLKKAYEREERTLEMRTNFMFRETAFALQSTKLKLDGVTGDSAAPPRIFIRKNFSKERILVKPGPDQKVVNMVDIIARRANDSSRKDLIIRGTDTMHLTGKPAGRKNRLMQFLFDVDSAEDSVKVNELKEAFAARLEDQNIPVPFSVSRVPTVNREEHSFHQVTLGFTNPITYQLTLDKTMPFLLGRIIVPILFSIFLVAFTFMSFSLLYINLLRQRRLADIKNEFISNITHELKTPIATVSVAIEALRNFSASMDAKRTREYLDISANELQRLSLLVDKVLKLSMFEKKEIELRYESMDMKDLVEEVTSSMRLQFEKKGATLQVNTIGDTRLEGDRLHLVSVIFNLLDNALKYSVEKAEINITVQEKGEDIELMVGDTGIGIPQEYQHRIFEKFFRVPTGNLHNAKGYGLGLSYVSHVIKKHRGNIRVESTEGEGSRFFVSLPKENAS